MKQLLVLCLFATLMFACKKDSDDDGNTLTSNAEFYFIGKLDGTVAKQEVTATNDVLISSTNGGSVGNTDCTLSYGCAIGPSSGLEPYFNVNFPDLFSSDCSTEGAVFHGLFHTGDWAYGNTTGKVQVLYFDGTELWSTEYGTQSGATFKVTRSEKLETIFGPSQTVGGSVSCQLYNSKGAVKKLEGGSFLLNFEPWF
ncbi:MAG TPA: hypothetical protein PK971_01595 [Saprospiraceae bacterium]|nr:hypothetical protein [Saprospiraceae bacterium]HND86987.1 hypothetical protein [Saprospiraceae bacterium]HNG89418.1 hypothetical protein [Saprospiraceae bacterium]